MPGIGKDLATALEELTEQLAAVEHARWSHWQRFVHSNGERLADGSLLLPADLVERWERQISREYAQLSEREKESDREQVRIYLPLIRSFLESSTRD